MAKISTEDLRAALSWWPAKMKEDQRARDKNILKIREIVSELAKRGEAGDEISATIDSICQKYKDTDQDLSHVMANMVRPHAALPEQQLEPETEIGLTNAIGLHSGAAASSKTNASNHSQMAESYV